MTSDCSKCKKGRLNFQINRQPADNMQNKTEKPFRFFYSKSVFTRVYRFLSFNIQGLAVIGDKFVTPERSPYCRSLNKKYSCIEKKITVENSSVMPMFYYQF